MTAPSAAHQRLLDIIHENKDTFQKSCKYQKEIDDLLDKISTPADRIRALSILLESKLATLSAGIKQYSHLQQSKRM